MAQQDTVHVLATMKLSKDLQSRFQGVSPRIKLHVHPADEPGDIPRRIWDRAEILYSGNVMPSPETDTSLKWAQSPFAGIENLLTSPYAQAHPELTITSGSGIHASVIGEYVLGMMLALGHHLAGMLQHQKEKLWHEKRYKLFVPRQIRGSTVGVLGYGSIGREVARLAHAFGATVLATKRTLKDLSDHGYQMEGVGDQAGDICERFYPPEATAYMVKDCDFVVITLPLTEDTHNLFDREMIDTMKSSAYLINVGRGGIVDEDALFEALEESRIAGAAFDVFSQEPLPAYSPLWKAPNMIITPHISGNMENYMEKAADIFEANLRRYLNGEPLVNVVSRELGY